MDDEKTLEQETLDNIADLLKVYEIKCAALDGVDRSRLNERDLEIEIRRLRETLIIGVFATMQHYQLNK